MIHINKFVKINHYKSENEDAYFSFLESAQLAKELQCLSKQKLKSGKNILILIEENNGYISKLITGTKEKVIGYCIVEDFQKMTPELKAFADVVFKIPLEVLYKYPVIISDFVIKMHCRKKGYGRKLAEHILLKLYPDSNISLYADEDGLFFWPIMGFSRIEDKKCIMYLNRGQSN